MNDESSLINHWWIIIDDLLGRTYFYFYIFFLLFLTLETLHTFEQTKTRENKTKWQKILKDKKEFNIVMLRQFRTLAMFCFLCCSKYTFYAPFHIWAIFWERIFFDHAVFIMITLTIYTSCVKCENLKIHVNMFLSGTLFLSMKLWF